MHLSALQTCAQSNFLWFYDRCRQKWVDYTPANQPKRKKTGHCRQPWHVLEQEAASPVFSVPSLRSALTCLLCRAGNRLPTRTALQALSHLLAPFQQQWPGLSSNRCFFGLQEVVVVVVVVVAQQIQRTENLGFVMVYMCIMMLVNRSIEVDEVDTGHGAMF